MSVFFQTRMTPGNYSVDVWFDADNGNALSSVDNIVQVLLQVQIKNT